MLKLFIRNKLVEIANFIYGSRCIPVILVKIISVLLIICAICAVYLLITYIAGFLTPYLHFFAFPKAAVDMMNDSLYISIGSQISAGSIIILMLLLICITIVLLSKLVIKIKQWIDINIAIAKQGIKVKKDWLI